LFCAPLDAKNQKSKIKTKAILGETLERATVTLGGFLKSHGLPQTQSWILEWATVSLIRGYQ
jgi:hypothetical protein